MLKHGDGTTGWKSQKPFDGILVAAAPLAVPEALFAQLANKGRLIVPVGPEGAQQLIRFTRRDEHLEREVLGAGGLRSDARRHRLTFVCSAVFE